MFKPAIVIVAYNRYESLARLLRSIYNANYHFNGITLVISIDYSDRIIEIEKLAVDFEWKHGEKKIVLHQQNLGLRNHILKCGDLTSVYGSIVMLEDDLFVSPVFYQYAIESLTFFKDNEKVGGIALYSPNYNETSQMIFQPLNNGDANYLMKVPCSWGQAWNENQWKGFTHYIKNQENDHDAFLPLNVESWNISSSWKKIFFKYLLFHNKYFVYPYYSFTTNFNDPGHHYDQKLTLFQTNLIHSFNNFNFNRDFDSSIVYDEYGELEPMIYKSINTSLSEYDFNVDIYGSKQIDHIKEPYLLSTKNCVNPLFSFGYEMIPPENNILYNIEGEFIHFGKTSDFIVDNSIWRKKEILNENMSKIPITLIKELIRRKMKNTRDYKLGHFLMKPIRFFK